MSQEKRSNIRQTVSSIGNSWIVSHSRSHPGHVYYFNTSTGEAVWNLSDAEIEKAAIIRQTNDSDSGLKPMECEEPQGNPPTKKQCKNPLTISNQQKSPIKIFHKKKHQVEEMFGQHPKMNILLPQQQTASVYSDIPMNDLSSFDLNALTNQINAYSAPSLYTTNVWPIPRTQQIIITPTIPLINQAQTNAPVNIAYNNLLGNDQGNNDTFKKFQSSSIRPQRLFQSRYSNLECQGRKNLNKLSLRNKIDLRQQLCLKRKLNNIAHLRKTPPIFEDVEKDMTEGASVIRTTTESTDASTYIGDMIGEELNSHEKTDVMDKISTDISVEEKASKLDLTPLKSLAHSNTKLEVWYIIIDLHVLLDEFNFINVIAESDKSCHVTIPETVMSELKDYIARTNNIPARRAYHTLLQKISSGSVFVAEGIQDYENTITNPILKTCLQLMDEKFHVILISKDSELINCKKFIKINIFSVDEVKSLLDSNICKDTLKLTSVSRSITPKLTREMPIVNPPQKKIIGVETSTEDTTLVKTVHVTETKEKETENAAASNSTAKQTVDAAIQTETVTVLIPDTNTNTVINEDRKENLTESSSHNKNIQESSNNVTIGVTPKKREIKLKRNLSNQPLSSDSKKGNERRTLRWRRNRNLNLPATTNDEKPSTVTQDNTQVASKQTDTIHDGTDEQVNQICHNEHESGLNAGEVVKSRGSSVICVDTRGENITIEETSTSGIISNTESNGDVESNENQSNEPCDTGSQVVLYEIDSEHMEESLNTKSEEWVLRFIQIMEGVLGVILHKETVFSNIEFPPPWTLHEAALCIGKYCNNASIKHITDKLTNILFKLSDSGGKINVNMTPCQYMEMYSYGVCLLNAVKAITTCCEDVEIAEDALQKLLSDIKSPQYGCNDSVIDPHEESPSMQMTNVNNTKSDINSPNSSKASYNLRSAKLKKITDTPVKVIRNFDLKSMFFANLRLTATPSPDTSKENSYCESQPKEQPITFSSGDDVDKTFWHIGTSSTAKIVRNFNKCAELEEKLKNKLNNNTHVIEERLDSKLSDHTNENEYLDYENDCENISEESRSDDSISSDGTVMTDPNVTQLNNSSDIDVPDTLVTSSPKTVDPLSNSCNDTFKLMICVFLEEVSKAIKEVKVLCDKCYAELKRPQLPTKERNELKRQIENAHLDFFGVCESLESMMRRDPNAPTDNMRNALKNAGINIAKIDRNLILEYWNTIANCKKNADVFLYSIQEIIAAFQT